MTTTYLDQAPFGPFTTIASASTTDLGTVQTVGASITGTTTITSFGTGANLLRFIKFAAALTLTHNATSLILPNAGSNITTAAGDTCTALSDGSGNWTVANYQCANGQALAGVILSAANTWASAQSFGGGVRFGAPDAASPSPPTVYTQSVVAGTSNTAGADLTLQHSLSTGTGVAGNRIVQAGFKGAGATSATVTMTIASPCVVTQTAHGFVTGQPWVPTTTGALPTGLTASTTYYVISTGANTFNLAASPGGAAINTSGSQSGTHTGTTSATVVNPAMTIATWGPSGLTGSQTTSLFDLKQTWNTTGTPTLIKGYATDTASNASSLLLDLGVGATSKFQVGKLANGSIFVGDNAGLSTLGYGTPASMGGYVKFASNQVQLGATASVSISTSFNLTSSTFLSFSTSFSPGDTWLGRGGATATLQFGQADAAAPVAQTAQVQSVVAGTSNTAGTNWTLKGSKGTGTAAGGQIILQTAPAGATGTSQNTLVPAITLTAPAQRGGATQQPSVVLGNAAIATADTDGFLYIPTCAGTPTGVPTTFTGRVALVYDTTNHQFWIYDGGWLQPKTPAGAALVTWQ